MENKNNFLVKKHVQGACPVRMSRIWNEFIKGFRFLKKYEKTVTFFGSSRVKSKNKYYQEAFNLASQLSAEGYTVVTGGGGGIMEAANKGAYMAGEESLGININLPQGEKRNKYVKNSVSFRYFFIRKVMLTFASQAYIFFPGGFGTLDEFFEIITLIQTKKVKKIPVILVHKSYWQPLLEWIERKLYKKERNISKNDIKIYYLVDNTAQALELLKKINKGA